MLDITKSMYLLNFFKQSFKILIRAFVIEISLTGG